MATMFDNIIKRTNNSERIELTDKDRNAIKALTELLRTKQSKKMELAEDDREAIQTLSQSIALLTSGQKPELGESNSAILSITEAISSLKQDKVDLQTLAEEVKASTYHKREMHLSQEDRSIIQELVGSVKQLLERPQVELSKEDRDLMEDIMGAVDSLGQKQQVGLSHEDRASIQALTQLVAEALEAVSKRKAELSDEDKVLLQSIAQSMNTLIEKQQDEWAEEDRALIHELSQSVENLKQGQQESRRKIEQIKLAVDESLSRSVPPEMALHKESMRALLEEERAKEPIKDVLESYTNLSDEKLSAILYEMRDGDLLKTIQLIKETEDIMRRSIGKQLGWVKIMVTISICCSFVTLVVLIAYILKII